MTYILSRLLCGYNASKRLQTLRENLTSRMAKIPATLIKTTTQVSATVGLIEAKTQEIARVAMFTKVTLFRHFQNKEQPLTCDYLSDRFTVSSCSLLR
ncbi:TetR family transcriptional regulator [Nostoc sp.]|uniref:TetR family transcriptional regulator n=1 Tax=Nostoc sp. TaxID=1180 RepID=UPI002FF9F1E9